MMLDEVMMISDPAERIRAFLAMSEADQNRLFTPDELAMRDACGEIYGAYCRAADAAFTTLRNLMSSEDAVEALLAIARLQAANELRCEVAGVPMPTLDQTLCAPNGPYRLLTRGTIDTFKQHIKRETAPV